MDAARGDGPQPDALQTALAVERFGADAVMGGGTVPLAVWRKLSQVSGIFAAVRALDGAKGDDIHRVNNVYGEMLAWLMDEGYLD